jgi:cytochrome c oxidase subunit II
LQTLNGWLSSVAFGRCATENRGIADTKVQLCGSSPYGVMGPDAVHSKKAVLMARFFRKLGRWVLVAGLVLLWLCVRFPYQMRESAERFLRISPELDPLTLHLRGEFVESNLGTAINSDGSATVRLIAQQYNFVPHCILVPAGASVDFRITSADDVHRFTIAGTDKEAEVVPGHISELRTQFASPGEYNTPCHEFCGVGHYNMQSRIVVRRSDLFPKLKLDERVNCAAP